MYPASSAVHSDFGDFTNGVCCVMKIMGLLTQQTSCLSPKVLARINKMLITTMSVVSDWGSGILFVYSFIYVCVCVCVFVGVAQV